MHCASCSFDDTKVIDSRLSEEGSAIRRRRSCTQCGYRFTTYERLEEVALNDEYFISRKLYPNVDFYSGLIYQALGFPVEMFTVLFAIPRTVGWLAHMSELLKDKEQKISRPRQAYTGVNERNYVELKKR